MFNGFIASLSHTPFYPHWLDFLQSKKAKEKAISLFKGRVIETGCGNAQFKEEALLENKKITEYIATDYSSWDKDFKAQSKRIKKFGIFTETLFGKPKDINKIDKVCDALHLPFKNSSFDFYFSHSVLEHIKDPQKFFSEASRVLKKKGVCVTLAPFLYREHGTTKLDFYRPSRGAYELLSKEAGFSSIKIEPVCSFGATLTALVNQYVICKIFDGNLITKIILLILSPFIFFCMNILGYIIEQVDHDPRFALHYLVVMKK